MNTDTTDAVFETTERVTEDAFAVSELPVPPAVPDVHLATIETVSLKPVDNENWPAQLAIKLVSENNPTLDAEYTIILPVGFYENVHVDPTTLPDNAQTSYRIGIANSEGTASLQKIREIATEQGRTAAALGLTKPTTIEEFVDNHAQLLSGLPCAFFRNVDKKADDPRFKNQLRVKGVVSREFAMGVKAFRKGGYVKQWENQ